MKTTFKSLAAGLAMMIATGTVTPSFSSPSHNTVSTVMAVQQKNHSANESGNSARKARREEKKKARAERKQAKAQAKQSSQSAKGKTTTK